MYINTFFRVFFVLNTNNFFPPINNLIENLFTNMKIWMCQIWVWDDWSPNWMSPSVAFWFGCMGTYILMQQTLPEFPVPFCCIVYQCFFLFFFINWTNCLLQGQKFNVDTHFNTGLQQEFSTDKPWSLPRVVFPRKNYFCISWAQFSYFWKCLIQYFLYNILWVLNTDNVISLLLLLILWFGLTKQPNCFSGSSLWLKMAKYCACDLTMLV